MERAVKVGLFVTNDPEQEVETAVPAHVFFMNAISFSNRSKADFRVGKFFLSVQESQKSCHAHYIISSSLWSVDEIL